MSFDVFLQAFDGEEAADGDGGAAVAVFDRLVTERNGSFARIRTVDGGADVYGVDDASAGLMFNHVAGEQAWDVIVEVARAGGFVILPAGVGTCVVSDSQVEELPSFLPEPHLVVASGAELLSAIRQAP